MAMNENFADSLISAIDSKKNPSVAGLDPSLGSLPSHILDKYRLSSGKASFKAAADAVLEFNKNIIDSLYDIVPAVKLQSAYYEQLGPDGISAMIETARYAKSKKLIVIGDVKRNDIGSTCSAYSSAYLGRVDLLGVKTTLFDFDAITVNSYLGYEGIEPFLDDCLLYGKGVFSLVKTSNRGSLEFQGIMTDNGPNYFVMGRLVSEWGRSLIGSKGYSSAGAVVGATFPHEAKLLREEMKNSFFLVPGYGAQGGGAQGVISCFNPDGCGAVINSSRSIMYAYMKENDSKNYEKHARDEALRMKKEITDELLKKGICRW
ncbi:MAG: orotidine-5'-phosphate decarboxylase [Spirochaetia bacterium]|nr:orotidine-5'-phosphate decarboxylase [Spirochaetia bacterium]